MRAIDTNVLIRLLVNDDQAQHAKVKKLFNDLGESEQVYVSLVVITELVWVLESGYGFDRAKISDTLDFLLEVGQVSFQNSIAIYSALRMYRKGADFADALISALASDAGCTEILTFDKGAVGKARMSLLK
jgi:predicted nucleic-acid-binding protein